MTYEEIKELAKESHKAFAVKEFKKATQLFNQIREADPAHTYRQAGDGAIHVVLHEEDGSIKKDKYGQEITEEVA